MTRHLSNSDRPITLIAPGRVEEAQARAWRRIASYWPSRAQPPVVQLLDLDEALAHPEHIAGSAALVVYHDDEPPPVTLHALADALQTKMIPAVALIPRLSEHPSRIAGDEILQMDSATTPVIVAAALYALLERQPTIDNLLHENSSLRRFQQGLRGQIEKVNEELQLASQVQRDFLPRDLPKIDGIDIAAFFRPCGYVSGDIYDVQRLDDRHIGFFVADAVGHGVPAALMTMALARTLHMTEIRGEHGEIVPPGEALGRLNREMIRRHGSTPRFATAVYGMIDLERMRVTVAGAGHPPPLRIRAGGIEPAPTHGSLLGVFPEDTYEEISFDIGEDEIVVIHTDGFETAFPEAEADHHARRIPTVNYLAHFQGMFHAIQRFDDAADSGGETREPRFRPRAGLVHSDCGRLDAGLSELAHRLDNHAGSLHQVDDLTAIVLGRSVAGAGTNRTGQPRSRAA